MPIVLAWPINSLAGMQELNCGGVLRERAMYTLQIILSSEVWIIVENMKIAAKRGQEDRRETEWNIQGSQREKRAGGIDSPENNRDWLGKLRFRIPNDWRPQAGGVSWQSRRWCCIS